MIPAGFLQDLLSRVDIADVVGRHVELKRGGANLMGLCPFHAEKSPSFSVSPVKQFYYCFGCGASGDAIRFLTEHTGMSFVDAVTELAQGVGMQVPQEQVSPEERQRRQRLADKRLTLTAALQRAATHYRTQLKASPEAIAYLKGRGLSGEVAARFGLGYAPPGWRGLASVFPAYDDPALEEAGLVKASAEEAEPPAGATASATANTSASTSTSAPVSATASDERKDDRRRYDWFRHRVMFPIRAVGGEIIGFGGRVLDDSKPKYLNSPETPVFSKGRELYGLFEARQAIRERGYALVVEGYMDVVALAQSGFANAVATLGTACTADHVQKLFRHTDSVVFSFDGDAAGRRAAGRALEAALPHATDLRQVRFLFLPPEHDPDSFVRERGPAAFEEAVTQAVPLSRQLLAQAAEGTDLNHAEGRARMLAHARPLWQALPEGALQRQLLGDLARAAELPLDDLQSLWRTHERPAPPPSAPQRHSGTPAVGSNGPGWSPADDNGEPWALDDGPPPELDSGSPAPKRWRDGGANDGNNWPRGGRRGAGSGGRGFDMPARRSPRLGARPVPAALADLAVRLLLRHSDWWDRLTADDHHLLHGLGGDHGALMAWLEQQLTDQGAMTWTALDDALQDHDLQDAARRIADPSSLEDQHAPEDLQRVLHQLWIAELGEQLQLLSREPRTDREHLQRVAELNTRMLQHKRALTAPRPRTEG